MESQTLQESSSLKTYLDSLASEKVNCDTVSDQTRFQLREQIAKVTIDQLAHEKEKAQTALQALKQAFAREELNEQSQAKYAILCKSHKDIFAPSNQNGKLTMLKELNEQTHKAMEEL